MPHYYPGQNIKSAIQQDFPPGYIRYMLDMPIVEKYPILERLDWDLKGILHTIAHAGYSSDRDYIESIMEELAVEYGELFVDLTLENRMLIRHTKYGTLIEEAFDRFLDILDPEDRSPEDIEQECEEILYDYLEFDVLYEADPFLIVA